jgi:hypothetical protein
MNELCDLKRLFESNNIEVSSFLGNILTTGKGDQWTMVHGVFYKNGLPIVEKEVVKSVLPPKQRIHKTR